MIVDNLPISVKSYDLGIPIYYASLFCSTEVYAVGYRKVIVHLATYWLLSYDRSFGGNPTL